MKQQKYVPLSEEDNRRQELNQNQQKLIHALHKGKTAEYIRNYIPGYKWALYGNRILDLENWAHPGGNFIIQQIIGREVSRFLLGSYPLESHVKTKRWKHSQQAYELIESLTIGMLSDKPESILVSRHGGKSGPKIAGWTTKATLYSKSVVSETLCRYDIELAGFEIKPYGKSTSWLGRHFILRTADAPGTGRNYTTANAMTP